MNPPLFCKHQPLDRARHHAVQDETHRSPWNRASNRAGWAPSSFVAPAFTARLQGGMHYVGYAELAAAVSNAGGRRIDSRYTSQLMRNVLRETGLGTVTALTQPNAEALRKEIRKCHKLTSKPFAVNVTLLPALVPPDYESYAKVIVEEVKSHP